MNECKGHEREARQRGIGTLRLRNRQSKYSTSLNFVHIRQAPITLSNSPSYPALPFAQVCLVNADGCNG